MDKDLIWQMIAKKLSGEASEAEQRELEILLRANPDLHYPIQAILDLWKQDPAEIGQEALQAFARHTERMRGQFPEFGKTGLAGEWQIPETGKRFSRNRLRSHRIKKLGIGAGLFAILVGVLVFGLRFYPTPPGQSLPGSSKTSSEISTRNGSRTNVALPDGSMVWLNAGSRLSYDKSYGNSDREVSLSGEAFFDVVHNPERPFVIHTRQLDIRVLGTRFNVKSYPADPTTETTLIRGSIEVLIKDRPSEKIILKPNEKLVVANTDLSPFRNPAVVKPDRNDPPIISIRTLTHEARSGEIVETSWLENKLIFQDESFKDLALEMERRFGVVIHFDDLAKEDLRFTGSFTNETVQQALDALQLSALFVYSIHENEVHIK
jgi:transmembrane sensor